MKESKTQIDLKPKPAPPATKLAREGMLIIISGPSGTGKGTLCDRLIAQDDRICFSVSVTTRDRRETETHGVHYRFVSEEEFMKLRDAGELLEYATVHDHHYGTPRKMVEEKLKEGYDVLLDVDSQGAMSVMKQMENTVSIFILPPSYASLKTRLHTRNTDDEAEIEKRLNNARGEIERYSHYDYALINDELESAFLRMCTIIEAERMRTLRFHPEIPEE
ncbi:MAG: guanylate kinase [Clostridiales bacterium]|nr:guanylate kinase [Clostridiales bacterium]